MAEKYLEERILKSTKKQSELQKQRFLQDSQSIEVSVLLNKIDQPEDLVDVKNLKENYKINIDISKDSSKKYQIELVCEGYVSFLRALESFFQLIKIEQDDIYHIPNVPLNIEDSPSYKWRGLMYDTARHFLTIDQLVKQIEAMRMNKLNVMHIHFTDSDSFPVVIPELQDLSDYGSYSKSQTYSLSDIDFIQTFAQQNGVLIVPEFDTPAHTRSWSLSPQYQETNACYNYKPSEWEKYCMQPPCGALDPTLQKTWTLVETVINFTVKQFRSKIMHMGGDEVVQGCWDFNPKIKEWMSQNNIKTYEELENYFRITQAKYIPKERQAMYWLNGGSPTNLTLRENDIIQFWDKESHYSMLQNYPNNDVVLSTYDFLYLDCGIGSMMGDNSWCDPYKTYSRIYSFDPEKAKIGDRLLGAEACLWSEMISNNNIDVMAWPRGIALGLRLWNKDEKLNQQKLVQKIVSMSDQLESQLKIKPAPITTEYCSKNIDFCFF